MKAAVLHHYGVPVYETFPDPVAAAGEQVVTVRAAAISRFDMTYASGLHYLKPTVLPCVAGYEGVGLTAEGTRVYFEQPRPPFGSMAERTVVPSAELISIPEGVDDAVAAVLGNSGLAAWLPLAWRAALKPGERVLVLGAGIVGLLAVQVAKFLGAGYVAAADRDPAALALARHYGADAVVPLTPVQDPAQALRTGLGDVSVDVVIDYLWGPPAQAALLHTAEGARVVQVGTVVGEELVISASVLRSRLLAILGFASYHAPLATRQTAYQAMAELARDGVIHVDVRRAPLATVSEAWQDQAGGSRQRLVLIP
jgi:NADPH2:quinone reductase